jgi:hypothetical protein
MHGESPQLIKETIQHKGEQEDAGSKQQHAFNMKLYQAGLVETTPRLCQQKQTNQRCI